MCLNTHELRRIRSDQSILIASLRNQKSGPKIKRIGGIRKNPKAAPGHLVHSLATYDLARCARRPFYVLVLSLLFAKYNMGAHQEIIPRTAARNGFSDVRKLYILKNNGTIDGQ
uniref:Uncharacterized protein n=1 Tax=Steinernema glaseri TaxID=37863 RepID=A0A1I7YGJ2_9BILA